MKGPKINGKQALPLVTAMALSFCALSARSQGNSQAGSYFGGFDGMTPATVAKKPSALDGVLDFNSPTQSSANRGQEAWDAQKNWVFKDLNDLFPADATPAPGIGMGSIGIGSQNSVEQYYENQGRKNATLSTSWKPIMSERPGANPALNPLSAWSPASPVRESSLFQPGDTDRSEKNNGDLIVKPGSAEDLLRGKKQSSLLEFKRMLDPNYPGLPPKSASSSLDSLLNATARPSSSANSALKFAAPAAPQKRSAMTPVLGVLEPPVYQPNLITGTTTKILGVEPIKKPSLEPEKPKYPKPIDPSANMPRRKF